MAGRRSFGTVRQMRSGRWQALWTHPETGRRHPAPSTFRTKGEATSWLSTAEADYVRGDAIDPTGSMQPFGRYAEAWLAAKKNIRPTTHEQYTYLLRSHLLPTFGEWPLGRISTTQVRVWHAELAGGSLSQTTAAKAYRLLRQILAAAMEDRLIRTNPCVVKGAATERSAERTVPSLEDVQRLADSIDPRYRAMVLIAAFAGLRKGECLGLARRHVRLDVDHPTVRVERSFVDTADGVAEQPPKTAAGWRTVVLPRSLAAEIQAHLDDWVRPDDDALLFTTGRMGDTPSKTTWQRIWRTARREAGVDCTFHDLRHVAGTLNAEAGATIKEAMARLGHTSPEAALRYQHAVQSRDSVIAEQVDRLIDPVGAAGVIRP